MAAPDARSRGKATRRGEADGELDHSPERGALVDHDARHGRARGLKDFPLAKLDVLRCVAAYVVFCAVGVGLGLLITHPLRHSWLQRTDVTTERWLAERRTPWMDTATSIGSTLADTVVKVGVTAAVVIAMLVVWKRWLEPLMVALALVIEASAFITITWIVGRPRPDVPRLEDSPVGSSFPSGHVAASVVYGAIVVVVFWHTRSRWIRGLSAGAVAVVAAATAFSRMYRGMHHPSDVLAGAILGLASVLVTQAIMRRVAQRRGERLPAEAPGTQAALTRSPGLTTS